MIQLRLNISSWNFRVLTTVWPLLQAVLTASFFYLDFTYLAEIWCSFKFYDTHEDSRVSILFTTVWQLSLAVKLYHQVGYYLFQLSRPLERILFNSIRNTLGLWLLIMINEIKYYQWRPTAMSIPIETHGFGSPFVLA